MTEKLKNIKERALFVAKSNGISYEDFCAIIGMSYGSFKGKAKERPLNSSAIENILTKFPNVDAQWLITGNGIMASEVMGLNEPTSKYKVKRNKGTEIPLFRLNQDYTLEELLDNPEKVLPETMLSIPSSSKCDAAVYLTTNTMYPMLKAGDIVGYKKISQWPSEIFWGETYLISLNISGSEQIVLHQVQISKNNAKSIKLVSYNPQYEDKEIDLDSFKAMAQVVFSIRF